MRVLSLLVRIVLLTDAVLAALLALDFIRIIVFVDRRPPSSAIGYLIIAFYIVLLIVSVWLYLVRGRLQKLEKPSRLKLVLTILFAYLLFPVMLILGVASVLAIFGIEVSENPEVFNQFAVIPIWTLSLLALALTVVAGIRATRANHR